METTLISSTYRSIKEKELEAARERLNVLKNAEKQVTFRFVLSLDGATIKCNHPEQWLSMGATIVYDSEKDEAMERITKDGLVT